MKPCSIAIALAFCVPLVSTSYAQPIPKARIQRLEAVAKELHLTREQEKQLVPILQAEEPKLQAIRERPITLQGGKITAAPGGTRRVKPSGESDPDVRAISATPSYTSAAEGAAYAGRKEQPASRWGGAMVNASSGAAEVSSARSARIQMRVSDNPTVGVGDNWMNSL